MITYYHTSPCLTRASIKRAILVVKSNCGTKWTLWFLLNVNNYRSYGRWLSSVHHGSCLWCINMYELITCMSMHELSVWETMPAWIEERPIDGWLDRRSFVTFVATTIYNDFGWTSLRRQVSVQEQDETDQTTIIYTCTTTRWKTCMSSHKKNIRT